MTIQNDEEELDEEELKLDELKDADSRLAYDEVPYDRVAEEINRVIRETRPVQKNFKKVIKNKDNELIR